MTNKWVITVVILCIALLVRLLWRNGQRNIDAVLGDVGVPDQLKAHALEYNQPEVIKVRHFKYKLLSKYHQFKVEILSTILHDNILKQMIQYHCNYMLIMESIYIN